MAATPGPPAHTDAQLAALDALSLADLEEAAGELHRRMGAALRRIGEARADETDEERRSPRQRVAALAVAFELAAATLGAVAAGVRTPEGRLDRHPASVAAVMYAAPSIPGLLARVEQDRRLLASISRTLEHRLAEAYPTPWGELPLRRVLTIVAITEPARVAQTLEALAALVEARTA